MNLTTMEIISAVTSVETYNVQGRTLEDIEKLPEETRKYFCEMIDECFLENQDDPELKEGFDILDQISRHEKITIYELVLRLYDQEELNYRINEWKKEKGYI